MTRLPQPRGPGDGALAKPHTVSGRRRATLFVAALFAGWIPAAPAISSEQIVHRVEVTLTGRHPREDSWDGTDGHAVMFRVALSSPPEIRVALVTADSVRFIGESATSPGSPCPDAEHCVFDVSDLPTTSAFALVVLDDDQHQVAAETVVAKTKVGAGRLRALAARVLSGGDDGAAPAEPDTSLPEGSEKMVAEALRLGGSAHDLVAVQVFLPSTNVPKKVLDAIRERVRAFIDEHADSWSSKARSRVSAQLPTRALEECLWPAPSCDTTYALISVSEL